MKSRIILGALAALLAATSGFASESKKRQTATEKRPEYLSDLKEAEESGRAPAAEPEESTTGRTEAEERREGPVGTQIAFFELMPQIGTVSIEDNSNFTVGLNTSFRVARGSSLYFEPSVLASFVNGDNNVDTTVYHVDAGLRQDFMIAGSALVPFVKAAVGPSISSTSGAIVNGEEISDSYLNFFAGGGLKVLISQNLGARLDTGVTFQGGDSGLYLNGGVVLPL